MSTLQKVNTNLTSILQSVNCPITLEPMTDAYSMLPCNHKVSKEGKKLLEQKQPLICPLDRLKITQFVEDKNYSCLVQQIVKLEASIKALNNELLNSSKEEIPITGQQVVQSMEHPGPNLSNSKSKPIHEQLRIQSPTLTDPLADPSSIDTNNPIEVLKALDNQIHKLKKNAATLTEPMNHSNLRKTFDFTSKILTNLPSELLFCNLAYKHAYWVTLQNVEIDTEGHNDFGKVSVLENMLPAGYYKDIFYRATIEFYLHYFSRVSSKPLFNYAAHQEYIVSTFKEHLFHDLDFSKTFFDCLNSYNKMNTVNTDHAIRLFLYSCYGAPKDDSKFHEYILKNLKAVWEKA